MPSNPAHPLCRALATATSTSVGVAVGVLLGGYLTAVSGSGAPGARALEMSDIAVLPAGSALVAFAVILPISLGLSALRRRNPAATADRPDHQPDRE